jgi:hypothetical protein
MNAKSILLYSDSHEGKTTQLYHLAKYLWETHQQKTRIITADLGGYEVFNDSQLVAKGIVDIADLTSSGITYAHLMKLLSLGYWFVNGKIQETEKYRNFDNVGAYFFEGVTSLSERYLDYIRNEAQSPGFKASWSFKDGDSEIKGLQEGHYGIVQQELYKWIRNTKSLPVKYVVWTSHQQETKVKGKGTMILPKAAGDAINFRIPSWFSYVFHMDHQEVTDDNGLMKNKRYAWFQEHQDLNKEMIAPATLRLLPRYYPSFTRYCSTMGRKISER